MDQLLELLGKYRCHLKGGSQSMEQFLKSNFLCYIQDVKQAINISDNTLVGPEMCRMVEECIDEIASNADKLVEILHLYGNGKIVEASVKAFDVFNIMKPYLMQRYSGAPYTEDYYRIRRVHDISSNFTRKDLFHIPRNKNHLVGTERYSMPGHPCLYLASQAPLAWYECGEPTNFVVAKFSIPQEENNHLIFVDFSEKLMRLMIFFDGWFRSDDNKTAVQKYLLKYIYTYPLRAACSVTVEHHNAKFVEEYIISQLLLQWVCNDEDFDGIRYESCSGLDSVKMLGGHNIVLVTKQFDADGYDIKLRNCIKVGVPQMFLLSHHEYDKQLTSSTNSNKPALDPFLFGMCNISDDFQQI